MKLLLKNLILLLAILYTGCENSDVIEISIPFEENIVIQAQFVGDEVFQGLRITRTLPVNETYSINKAEVKDAFAYLLINDKQVVPLHYKSDGIYLPIKNLIVKNGDKVELWGNIDKTSFFSQTFVPKSPVILNSNYSSSGKYMEATIQAQPDEVYGAIWSIDRQNELSAEDFYSLSSSDAFPANINVRTTVLPEIYQSPSYNGRRFVQVFSFDKQFKAFFNSKNNNQPINHYFIEGGGSISWNVQGNHVIGLFIGMAKNHL